MGCYEMSQNVVNLRELKSSKDISVVEKCLSQKEFIPTERELESEKRVEKEESIELDSLESLLLLQSIEQKLEDLKQCHDRLRYYLDEIETFYEYEELDSK